MSDWIEASDLAAIVRASPNVAEAMEDLEKILEAEPLRMFRLDAASLSPLDLRTYQVRLARSKNDVAGPQTYQLQEFVEALHGLKEQASAVFVRGEVSTYILLVDAGRSSVIASTAIDPPADRPDRDECRLSDACSSGLQPPGFDPID